MQKKVSVIVPVYNGAEHLAECLGHLIQQTLHDMEIILINDASTDHSLSIMKQYQSQYPQQIHVIDSPINLGAGGARNLGIEAAAGQFIGFVDIDDLADPAMYEKLYHTAVSTGYDIIDGGYYCQQNDMAILHTPDECTGVLTDEKRKTLIVGGGYIMSKLFRKDLFLDKNLRFRQNVILEDADFLTYLFATASSIGNRKEILYFYRDQPNSASKVIETEKYYYNICEAMRHLYQKTHGLSNYAALQPALEYEMLQMYSYGINICLQAYLKRERHDLVKMLQDISSLKKEIVTGGYENPYVKDKIEALDINIMKLNDLSPEQLLKSL